MRLAAPLALALALATPALADSLDESLQQRVTLSFVDTPLDDVLHGIRGVAQVNVVIDPALDPANLRVTADAREEPVGDLLAEIEKQLDLRRTKWCGAFYLYRGEGPGPAPDRGANDRYLRAPLSVNFDGERVPTALDRIQRRARGVTFLLPAGVQRGLRDRDASVDLRLWSVEIRHILTHLTRQCGLAWEQKDGKIELSLASEAARRTIEVAPVPDAIGEGARPTETEDLDKLVEHLRRPDRRGFASRRLAAVGEAAAPAVARLLDGPDPDVRLAALEVLARIGTPGQARATVTIFTDDGRTLEERTAAGEALGRMAAPATIPTLIDHLDDKWFRISEVARKALIAIGPPVIAPLRERYLTEMRRGEAGSDEIIYRALLIFGAVGGDSAQQILLEALETRQGPRAVALRHHAAIGLGFTGKLELVEPMIEALKVERQFQVASYVVRSLKWILTSVDDGFDTSSCPPPQGLQWEDWWRRNKTHFVEVESAEEEEFQPLGTDFGDLPPIEPRDR